ncbi:MAG: XdhC family protein [Woeseiaceae bacterium]|nr:XdhC family protein [Woeseiaceae bacterium]
MKRAMLTALVAARRNRQAAVLVRGLTSGRQCVVTERECHGDTDVMDASIIQAARAALRLDGASVIEASGEPFLVQTEASPVRLFIIGAVHIAQALIPMARQLGFELCLIDPRTAFASPERFPDILIDNRWPKEAMPDYRLDARTAVVALSHDPKIDEPALQAAMDSSAFYIGALGSKANHLKRLGRLAALGYSDEQLRRIHGPIGLPLGGRSPAEIAVSTLAQVIQSRNSG